MKLFEDELDIPGPVYRTHMRDLPSQERPRERLLQYGAEQLASAELVAILLRTGTQQQDVVELAKFLLGKYRGLNGIARAAASELSAEMGLGSAKVCQIKAALELGKRLLLEQPEQRVQISSVDEAATIAMAQMRFLDHEEMHIILLDTKNRLVQYHRSYKGTVNSSVLRCAEIYRLAIIRNCPRIIVCHNHPSGDPTPSPEDLEVTEQLHKAGQVLDIELLDHIVIGDPEYASLREHLNW